MHGIMVFTYFLDMVSYSFRMGDDEDFFSMVIAVIILTFPVFVITYLVLLLRRKKKGMDSAATDNTVDNKDLSGLERKTE